MSRQQKDHDIARMNALTNAVNFLSAFSDRLENETEVSDLVLKVADKFTRWILADSLRSDSQSTNNDPVQRETDRIKNELRNTPPGEDGTPPYYDEKSGKVTNIHQSNGDNMPITKKQRGYLIGLLRERGFDVCYEEIDALTVSQASDWISDLKNAQMRDNIKDPALRERAHRSVPNHNGDGKRVLREVRKQIKDRKLAHTLVN